ncbi:hypothetical protein GXW82_03580 [Streptacidiphilus sp. 4-A2]|nr:hypothetical protein [Streptacidiphilus sp. 4-A2]
MADQSVNPTDATADRTDRTHRTDSADIEDSYPLSATQTGLLYEETGIAAGDARPYLIQQIDRWTGKVDWTP